MLWHFYLTSHIERQQDSFFIKSIFFDSKKLGELASAATVALRTVALLRLAVEPAPSSRKPLRPSLLRPSMLRETPGLTLPKEKACWRRMSVPNGCGLKASTLVLV